jgi:hypothetical protein
MFTNIAYSACPEGMTGAQTETNEYTGITTVQTICCPTAYDFAVVTLAQPSVPPPIPSDGTTYSAVIPSTYTVCKAASVKELSDQEVTLTVSRNQSHPTLITKTKWDYENGFIVATPAVISKRLYTDPVAGTASTCFGPWWGCPQSNPFVPRLTSAPRPWDRETLRPLPAVTQPTLAPPCPSGANP